MMKSDISLIQIIAPTCNKPAHEGEQIRALCQNFMCTESKSVCFKCLLELHKDCINCIIMLENVPQMLEPFLKIQSDLAKLEKDNVLPVCAAKKIIDQLYEPINAYLQNPTLTNLNRVGVISILSFQFPLINTQMKFLDNLVKNLGMNNKNVKLFFQNIETAHQLFQQKKYNEGKEYYIKACKINPLSIVLLNSFGLVLLEQGNYEEAINHFDITIEINPQFTIGWINKGITLHKQDEFLDAIDCYEEALKITPNLQEAWYYKGLALYELNQFQEAIDCYEEAIKINHMYFNAWNQKGLALFELCRYQEAIDCYEVAITIDPAQEQAIKNLENAKQIQME